MYRYSAEIVAMACVAGIAQELQGALHQVRAGQQGDVGVGESAHQTVRRRTVEAIGTNT